jgi:hypothetical protein
MSDQSNKAALEYLLQQSQSLLEENPSKWKFQPLGLKQFAWEHLKIELTDRQLIDSLALLGEDPEKVFAKEPGSAFNVLCLIAGKGSGKDFMGAVVLCYCLYLLLCMKSPHEFLDWPITESIDMLVISFTGEQAREISFDKVKQMMKHWIWLKQNFSIIEGDRYVTPKGKPEILILADRIKTWNNIKIMAEHSASEGYEGYNVLFWIMSESSAFTAKDKVTSNGWKVFNTLRSSASTRFQKRWKGMVYSYLRFDERNDFTWLLYEQAVKDPSIYRDKCYPWEFKPSKYYSEQTFEFDGVRVPVSYQDESVSNPSFFRKAILNQIPKVGDKVVAPEVSAKATHDFPPLIILKNTFKRNLEGEDEVVAEIIGLAEKQNFVHDYLLSVDLGKKFAATGISLNHLDVNVGVICDCTAAWTHVPPASKDKGIPVNMEEVRDKLITIGKAIPSIKIGFDQWQSILYEVELKREGIDVVIYHVRVQDYTMFEMALAAGVARIPNDPELLRQFNALIIDGREVTLDTRISTRKDMVDATIGAFKVLREGFEKPVQMPPGSFLLSNNLRAQGGSFIPSSHP